MRESLVAVLLALGLTSLSYGGDGSRSDGRDTGEQGKHRVLKVFDAQGKSVGPLVTFGVAPGVVLHVNGATILVPIGRPFNKPIGSPYPASQYAWSDTVSYYPTTDCSGPPAVLGGGGDASDILRPKLVMRQGADVTAYIAPDTQTTDITLQSYGGGGNCTTLGHGHYGAIFTAKAWNPQSTYSLTQNYPEPLTIHY